MRTFTGELGEFQVMWEQRMQQQGVIEKEVERLNQEAQSATVRGGTLVEYGGKREIRR